MAVDGSGSAEITSCTYTHLTVDDTQSASVIVASLGSGCTLTMDGSDEAKTVCTSCPSEAENAGAVSVTAAESNARVLLHCTSSTHTASISITRPSDTAMLTPERWENTFSAYDEDLDQDFWSVDVDGEGEEKLAVSILTYLFPPSGDNVTVADTSNGGIDTVYCGWEHTPCSSITQAFTNTNNAVKVFFKRGSACHSAEEKMVSFEGEKAFELSPLATDSPSDRIGKLVGAVTIPDGATVNGASTVAATSVSISPLSFTIGALTLPLFCALHSTLWNLFQSLFSLRPSSYTSFIAVIIALLIYILSCCCIVFYYYC